MAIAHLRINQATHVTTSSEALILCKMRTLFYSGLFLAALSVVAVAQTTDLEKCTYTSKEGKVYDLSPLISTRQAPKAGAVGGSRTTLEYKL